MEDLLQAAHCFRQDSLIFQCSVQSCLGERALQLLLQIVPLYKREFILIAPFF